VVFEGEYIPSFVFVVALNVHSRFGFVGWHRTFSRQFEMQC
jgi:hypothetical protein